MSITFLAPSPLIWKPTERPSVRTHTSPKCLSTPPFHDTFSVFSLFCHSTQDDLCKQLSNLDGLGTFQNTPTTFPAPRHNPLLRQMQGGRHFDTAVISIWRPHSPSSLLLTPHTHSIQYPRQAVGLSIKLQPRDENLPGLRADAHYFEVAGGRRAWWFAGTADVWMKQGGTAFEKKRNVFLEGWRKLMDRYRVEEDKVTKGFLEDCWNWDVQVGKDRVVALGLMKDMVDRLLPMYEPLLGDVTHKKQSMGEGVEEFCIDGGGVCESSVVNTKEVGSWRLSVGPSKLSEAGKVYRRMRNDMRSMDQPMF